MGNHTLLQTINLSKKFKNTTAVEQLNLSLSKSDIFGFLGPNGAGKSTTIRLILGLVRPSAGEIKLFNKSLKNRRAVILRKVGALVEKPNFYHYLSGRKNLEIVSTLIGKCDPPDIERVLKIVDLLKRADDKVKTYSQGMKQRLGIAQALLGQPGLIILDEPTTGLDPKGMRDIRDLIRRLSEQGLTIFLSSHLLHEVEQLCNQMAIINQGKLVVQGAVFDLLNREKFRTILSVDRPNDAVKLLTDFSWIKIVNVDQTEIMLSLKHSEIPHMVRILIENSFNIYALRPLRSLEDYFLSILKDE